MMKLHVYFDYTCPFCYLGIGQLTTAAEAFPEIGIAWHPFELLPEPMARPEHRPDPETGALWPPALVDEAEKAGLLLRRPFSPTPYTNRAFQGMHFMAAHRGDVQDYNRRVFRAHFEQGRDIGRIDVLADIVSDLGADAYAFNISMKEGRYSDAQQKALRHAYFESGVEEVPTYKLAGLRISGAVGRQTMEKFLSDGLKNEQRSEQKSEAVRAETRNE
ncbi:MAG: DsbA family protein [Clostridiales Family XIII bacterium]|jgi:predicted DsbA family dithiol-disulfide isomerase|nr:DsbA family protein [Clostridiales Family XIII bacterium]